jgi:hypothetical protein
MFDFFFNAFRNPWLMFAGILLISLPIIIHLINRIRFKRIRWAAMEFLLKSQKRNRRRLILEQLLLLALRCLLVGLVGLLVARFVTDIGRLTAQDTRHYVLIDDTVSMNDHWQEQGKDMNCFEVAKAFTRAIAKTAVQEDTPQHMKVVLLSDPEHAIFDDRLNASTLNNLEATLATLDSQATLLHIDPAVGFKAANDFFAQHSEDKKVMHFLSDLRDKDWNNTSGEVTKQVDNLTQTVHANVFLMDCAHPFRNENQQTVLHHDNLAITDLQPDTRYASKDGQLIEFTLSIQNYSPSERKDYPLKVYREGSECFEVPPLIPSIPVGHSEFKFSLGFSKEGYNQVTAVLGEEKTGLYADNIRHALVEVRARIPVLVVDGGFPDVESEFSDTRFVREALKAARGYEVVSGGVDALEKGDLYVNYPSIFLLNVKKIEKGKALANLEEYVRKGGRIAFFLGKDVDAVKYNETLYNGGNGLFPVPLATRPTEKLKKDEREDQMVNGQFKVFLRVPEHPIVHGLASVSEILRYLLIDQYYPVLPRFQWAGKNIEELATLPSRKELGDFAVPATELLAKLPIGNPQYVNFDPSLIRHRDNIKKALLGKYLFELAAALDAMLTDRGDPEPDPKKRDPNRPNLVVDFWSLPELQEMKNNFEQLRDSVKYGDPLIVAKRFGKGHVVACMTSASTRWNEWAGGSVASFTFPIVVTDLQKYLTGGNEESNKKMGETIDLTRDATSFEPKIHHTHSDGFEVKKTGGEKDGAKDKDGPVQDLGQTIVEPNKDGQLIFSITQKKKSGMDEVILYGRGDPVPPPEYRAFVFNVDTEAESDLRRAAKDKLERNTSGGSAAQEQGKVTLVIGNDKLFKQGATLEEIQSVRKSDWSEEPWFYLLFIVILVVEQALAVHLSFHLKGGAASEGSLPAQVLRSQGIGG